MTLFGSTACFKNSKQSLKDKSGYLDESSCHSSLTGGNSSDKGGYGKRGCKPAPPCDCDCLVRTDKKSTCKKFLSEHSKTFTVNVTCEHDDDICVHFFGNPCEVSPPCKQYVNSLGHKVVKGCSGSKATFTYETAAFAACQMLHKPAAECQSTPICLQNCRVKDKCDKKGDACNLHFDYTEYPILSDPCRSHCVEDGCFEINTPFYCKESCGEGIGVGLGGIACKEYQMCSYFVANPGTKYQMKPSTKFYVALGACKKGECVDFEHAMDNAAVCDTSKGEMTFNVVYTKNCSWTVNGGKCYSAPFDSILSSVREGASVDFTPQSIPSSAGEVVIEEFTPQSIPSSVHETVSEEVTPQPIPSSAGDEDVMEEIAPQSIPSSSVGEDVVEELAPQSIPTPIESAIDQDSVISSDQESVISSDEEQHTEEFAF